MPSLLPPNSTRLERAVADATAVDLNTTGLRHIQSAAMCQPQLLPWLAWERSVDDWDDTWTVDIQRSVIAASIEIHRKKGTVGAVRKALHSLGHSGKMIEWWERVPNGPPHTFVVEVEIETISLNDATAASISRQIEAVKPVRSHFTLQMIGRSTGVVHAACVALSGEIITIFPTDI